MVKKRKLALKEEVYELEGEGGVTRVLKVRELAGPQLAAYMQTRLQNFVNGQDASKGVKSYAGIFTNLLQFCVYENDKLVPLDEINRWPSSLHQEMAADAMRLSGLAPPEVQAETNGQAPAGHAEGNPTTPTSPGGVG